MAELPQAAQIARRVADALESIGVNYAIGGAIAYGFHAPPRTTNDVDINIFCTQQELDQVFATLQKAGARIDHALARKSANERGDFVAWVDGMRVDVFVPSIPLSEAAGKRVATAQLTGRPIKILSAEDLVLFKLLFYRGKDLRDVAQLVAFQQRTLDRAYIRRWLVDMVGERDERVTTWDRLVAEYGC